LGLGAEDRLGWVGVGLSGPPIQEGRGRGPDDDLDSVDVDWLPNLAAHWGQTDIEAPSIVTFRPGPFIFLPHNSQLGTADSLYFLLSQGVLIKIPD